MGTSRREAAVEARRARDGSTIGVDAMAFGKKANGRLKKGYRFKRGGKVVKATGTKKKTRRRRR